MGDSRKIGSLKSLNPRQSLLQCVDRAVALKSAMLDFHWRFKKLLDIGLRFGSFSLPWKH
jgi:hypothetical protein